MCARLRLWQIENVGVCGCVSKHTRFHETKTTIHVLIEMQTMIVSCSSSVIHSIPFRNCFYLIFEMCSVPLHIQHLQHNTEYNSFHECHEFMHANTGNHTGSERARQKTIESDDVWETDMLELFMWYGADAPLILCTPHLLRNEFRCCCCFARSLMYLMSTWRCYDYLLLLLRRSVT